VAVMCTAPKRPRAIRVGPNEGGEEKWGPCKQEEFIVEFIGESPPIKYPTFYAFEPTLSGTQPLQRGRRRAPRDKLLIHPPPRLDLSK